MEISPNFLIGSAESLKPQETKSRTDLGMEDFLQIMAASLRMPSMDAQGGGGDSSTDYMAQMIQYTTLEQLKDLTETMQSTMLMTQQQQALSLVGKEVRVSEEGAAVTGIVEKVKFQQGYATIEIAGKEYQMNSIQEAGLKG